MTRAKWTSATAILLLVVSLTSLCSADFPFKFRFGEPKTIHWVHDLKAAHQLSVKENKPMMITFGASWCTYCKKMDETTLTDAKMVDYIEANFIPVHLDFDKNRETAKVLEIETLPTTVILSPRADLLGRIVGFKKVDDLKDELKASQNNLTTTASK